MSARPIKHFDRFIVMDSQVPEASRTGFKIHVPLTSCWSLWFIRRGRMAITAPRSARASGHSVTARAVRGRERARRSPPRRATLGRSADPRPLGGGLSEAAIPRVPCGATSRVCCRGPAPLTCSCVFVRNQSGSSVWPCSRRLALCRWPLCHSASTTLSSLRGARK